MLIGISPAAGSRQIFPDRKKVIYEQTQSAFAFVAWNLVVNSARRFAL
jgi:hypothetical protein